MLKVPKHQTPDEQREPVICDTPNNPSRGLNNPSRVARFVRWRTTFAATVGTLPAVQFRKGRWR